MKPPCTKCNSNTKRTITIKRKTVCLYCLSPIKITDINQFLNTK